MAETDVRDEPPDAEKEGRAGEASLHETLVSRLRQLMIEGTLESGRRIPEADLCRRFGVSRTPLREALKVLAAQGFVELRPNRGAIVAPVYPDQIGPIFELKGALERLIGLTAAARVTQDDLDHINALHLELGAALDRGDMDDYTRLNYAFHKGLAQVSGNALLCETYDGLQQRIWRYRFVVNEDFSRVADSFAEHDQIMIALRARTPLDLAARLEAHNLKTCEAMLLATRQMP
ncbi:GntR family transcriptional regulator [Marinibacterium profundimaris]|uniref:Transcriptional regulator n=1 Tax=Marinibacterium profundimaris TaxID=1679460 RepID=A0A225NED9_9RHOB|nr:GntR family transcriptional regulator [Marinibacterium profundimaris]OWU70957.1 transcriptional regulator [Marinibacterium profundimaris]